MENNIAKANSVTKTTRITFAPGDESIEQLRKMQRTGQHGHELYNALLLREVQQLRASEKNLQQEISDIKEQLSARHEDSDGSSSAQYPDDDEASEVVIGEPVASLLGVDGRLSDKRIARLIGEEGDDIDNGHNGKQREHQKDANKSEATVDNNDASSGSDDIQTVSTAVLIDLQRESSTERKSQRSVNLPPGYRRCMLCAHTLRNTECSVCNVDKTQAGCTNATQKHGDNTSETTANECNDNK